MGNNGKDNASLLSGTELSHDLTLHVARAPVAAKETANFVHGHFWHKLLLKKVKRSHGQVKLLFEMLSETGNLEMRVLLDLTLGGLQLATNELE